MHLILMFAGQAKRAGLQRRQGWAYAALLQDQNLLPKLHLGALHRLRIGQVSMSHFLSGSCLVNYTGSSHSDQSTRKCATRCVAGGRANKAVASEARVGRGPRLSNEWSPAYRRGGGHKGVTRCVGGLEESCKRAGREACVYFNVCVHAVRSM